MSEASGAQSALGTYRSSFSSLLQPKTILLLFYDLLFWALFFVGLIAYPRLLEHTTNSLDSMGDNLIAGLQNAQAMTAGETVMRVFLLSFIALTVAWILWSLLAWTFTRGMIWQLLTGNNRWSVRIWVKFFFLNLLWFVLVAALWLLVFGVMGKIVPYGSFAYPGNAPWLLLTAFVLLLGTWYFTEILNYMFVLRGTIFGTLRETLFVGARKFRALVPAYLAVIGTFLLLMVAAYALRLLPEQLSNVIAAILLLLFAAWMREYLIGKFSAIAPEWVVH